MPGHRRLARRERLTLSITAAATVVGYLVGVVFLTYVLVWLRTFVSTAWSFGIVGAVVLVGSVVFTMLSPRFAGRRYPSDAEQSVIDQVAALECVGVTRDEAERVVRDTLLDTYRSAAAQHEMVDAVAGAQRDRAGGRRGQGDEHPKTASLPTGSYL